MEPLTVFVIGVGSYAILVALTFILFKAAMSAAKEASQSCESNEGDVLEAEPGDDSLKK
ncbi:hypothetical protein V7O66_12065 [Methanolobus sp. ZRKC3]|uniref:hypothetical protein n=1 Tax=Methanolobus sp. ZRKC3 TaxID=3125786 RepID=UPI00324BC9C7